MTQQTARNAIRDLESAGVLEETTGKARYQEFKAADIFEILDQPSTEAVVACTVPEAGERAVGSRRRARQGSGGSVEPVVTGGSVGVTLVITTSPSYVARPEKAPRLRPRDGLAIAPERIDSAARGPSNVAVARSPSNAEVPRRPSDAEVAR